MSDASDQPIPDFHHVPGRGRLHRTSCVPRAQHVNVHQNKAKSERLMPGASDVLFLFCLKLLENTLPRCVMRISHSFGIFAELGSFTPKSTVLISAILPLAENPQMEHNSKLHKLLSQVLRLPQQIS